MTSEIKIERKASEVFQPQNEDDARQVIRSKKDLTGADLAGMDLHNLNAVGLSCEKRTFPMQTCPMVC